MSADLINHLVRRESQRLQKLSGGRIDADWDAVAREALSIPNYHPPVSELVVGRDGRIWLRREETTDDAVTWNVFDEQGKLTAMLRAPKQIKLYQADRGYAWGVEHDELDVPYIVRYRVTSK